MDPRLEGSETERDIPPDVRRGLGQITRPERTSESSTAAPDELRRETGQRPGASPRDGQTDSSPGSGAPRNQQWAPACPPAHPFCWDTGAPAGKPDAR